MRFPNVSDWNKRREISYRLNQWDDVNLPYLYVDRKHDDLANRVIGFFENGSELEFPAKYVFCNIIYAYYIVKYFGGDFYQLLDDKRLLFDSPSQLLYHDDKYAYDKIIAKVLPNLESYQSIKKTRDYFNREFMIN